MERRSSDQALVGSGRSSPSFCIDCAGEAVTSRDCHFIAVADGDRSGDVRSNIQHFRGTCFHARGGGQITLSAVELGDALPLDGFLAPAITFGVTTAEGAKQPRKLKGLIQLRGSHSRRLPM